MFATRYIRLNWGRCVKSILVLAMLNSLWKTAGNDMFVCGESLVKTVTPKVLNTDKCSKCVQRADGGG